MSAGLGTKRVSIENSSSENEDVGVIINVITSEINDNSRINSPVRKMSRKGSSNMLANTKVCLPSKKPPLKKAKKI